MISTESHNAGPVTSSWRERWRKLLLLASVSLLPGWISGGVASTWTSQVWPNLWPNDARLFLSGAMPLSELIRLNLHTLQSIGAMTPVLGVLAIGYGGLLLLWTLMSWLPTPMPDAARPPALAMPAHARRLLEVLGWALLARALLIGLAMVLARGLLPLFIPLAQERQRTMATLVVLALAALVWGGIRLGQDLANAAVSIHQERGRDAWITALTALGKFPWRALGTWLFWGGARILLVGSIVVSLPYAATRGGSVWPWILLHQTIFLALFLLRAAWLRAAMVLVAPLGAPSFEE